MGRPRTVERQVDPLVVALRDERVRQGVSQTALAERMGLATYGTICEHERGVNQPGLGLLRRWSAALGCALVIQTAQTQYDAAHDAADHHCLADPCAYHPGETRIRPLPTSPGTLLARSPR